ncbi:MULTISPECIES: SRPBCC family protein [unclassified Arthrobacter]|uniref:SRPBCC family protein n=1 Tax=unclassified Arthrobacter TaxID=235627 RepID=UPI002E091799|nr:MULTISPECIES: SRPBCC family protein [unclassified Arthrobacter]MEC5191331.1 ribosome-associated toxin RatA of RatAB toxin-antitoxin module [Arthrobacter sp. MP_M4]MEC5202918.1 ribosome-associated toxin RatA of RatAB toxin-antitoxin module [Arthrobacter sp. MP_M7]
MSTRVEKRVLVNVPVSVAYNQWTQFEDFPQFMGGIKSVQQLSDNRLEWVAEIAGVRRKWQASILEQIPDHKVAWAATEGATNAGSVTFEDLGGGQTSVQLALEYEPEGVLEKVGDKLHIVEKQAEGDLNRFKAFIEAEGYATGAWRGTVGGGAAAGTADIDAAAGSRGDSGKAGVSGKVMAGVGLAAAAVAGVAAATGNKESTEEPAEPATAPVRAASTSTLPPTGTTGSVFPAEGMEDPAHPGTGTVGRADAKPFDQTNGLVDIDGDSDGTAASDAASEADRAAGTNSGPGTIPPAPGALGQH